MRYWPTIVLFAFLQAPHALAEPLRSGCSPDDRQIAVVTAADVIQVETALAGEDPKICYKIVVNRGGQNITGYVLGESLPALAAFVRLREQESKAATEAQARMAMAPPKSETKEEEAAKPLDPNVPSHIDNFSWRDVNGKAGSLSALGGRVTLITFWPVNSLRSKAELNNIMPLYNELHGKGLAAVGVGMDANPQHMNEVLDDAHFNWPQVPDRTGLAAQYHVNPKSGETFVLDASHRVIAAGPMGPEIEKAVRQLLATP